MEGLVIKESWIEKRSRYLKEWRKRWAVLTNDTLRTFKRQGLHVKATETIDLHEFRQVKPVNDNKQRPFVFKLESRERGFYFSTDGELERAEWIKCIEGTIKNLTILRTKSEDDALNEF